MAVLCGVDIVQVPKMEKILRKEGALKQFLHQTEIKGDTEHLSGIIAAKEAFFKAIGKTPDFLAVEITHTPSGKPEIKAAPELCIFKSCDVSISHDGDYAIAFVVLQK